MLRIVLTLFLSSILFDGTLAAAETISISKGFGKLKTSPHSFFLEDPASGLGIEQALQNFVAGKFFQPEDGKASFGFSPSSWWMISPIENRGDTEIAATITQRYALVDLIEYWLVTPEGQILGHRVAGDRHIAKDSDHPTARLPYMNLKLPPGKSYLVSRIKTDGSVAFDLMLLEESAYQAEKIAEYTLLAALLGMLAIMATYNLFIFLQLRKSTYLIYALFVLTMIYQPLSYSGLMKHIVGHYDLAMNEFFLIVANLSCYLVISFSVPFLSINKRHPKLMLLCVLSLLLPTLGIVFAFIDYNTSAKLSVLGAMNASFTALICGITLSLQRFRPAYFFTLAWTTLIIANFVRMMATSGAIEMSAFTEWGVVIGSVIEAALISLALADKVRLTEKNALSRISALNDNLRLESDKVRNLNENLERLVEEKTREIQSIMKNIPLGVLVVKGEELLVSDTYSRSCQDILRTKSIASSSAIDLIFHDAKLDKETKAQVDSVLRSSIGEDEINFETNEHLLPQELVFQFMDEIRYYQFNWKAILDENNLVEKILVVVKDVTEIKQLEDSALKKSLDLEYIGEILDVSSQKFSTFITSSLKFMEENKRLIVLNHILSTSLLKRLFINLHTIKGAARSLGFKNLTPMVHDLEQMIADMISGKIEKDRELCAARHHECETLLLYYEQLNSQKLGRKSKGELSIEKDYVDRILLLLRRLQNRNSLEERHEMEEYCIYLEDLSYCNATELFEEIALNAEMLARDLQKEYPIVDITSSDIFVSQEGQQIIRDAFIHIIRNSMDHGIERPEERLRKGKDEAGHIKVALSLPNDVLCIEYVDDGAGLDLSAIKSKAIELGILAEETHADSNDIASLIFESGFSTARDINDISGRGVGMSAIREHFEKHGGQVRLELLSESNIDASQQIQFKLIMTLPRKYIVCRSSKYMEAA